MPVINLPRDTRFSELGEGLGKLISGVAEAYSNKRLDEGVAAILQDPSVADTDKGKRIYKDFGNKGYQRYKEYLGVDVLRAGIEGKLAEAQKYRAAAAVAGGQEDMARWLFGLGARQQSGVSQPGTQGASGAIADVLGGGAPTSPQAASAPATPAPTAQPNVAATAFAPAPTQSATPPAPLTVPAPNTSMMPSAVPAPAPPPAATTPTGISSAAPIRNILDQRASIGGVTFTPDEKEAVLQEAALAIRKDGMKGVTDTINTAVTAKQKGTTFPFELKKTQNEAAQSDIALTNAKTVQPTVGPSAEAALVKSQADAEAAQRTTALGRPTITDRATVMKAYPSFTAEQADAVVTVANAKGAGAATDLIEKTVAVNKAAGINITQQQVDQVRDIALKTETFTNVMNDIETNPRLNGGLWEAYIQPHLARVGYDFGKITPADYAEMGNASQLALQSLQGHRGYGGAYLVKAVAETMPTAAKQKIFKAIESHYQARQDIVNLESLRRAAQDRGQNTGQIDAEIEKARELERRTGSLWWTGDKRVFYKRTRDEVGREINPDTWLPVQGGAIEFKAKDYLRLGPGVDETGAVVNKLAREAGITPGEMLAKLRAKYGGAPSAAPVTTPAPTAAPQAPAKQPSDLLPWTIR